MSTDLSSLARGLASQLGQSVRDSMADDWGAIPDGDKDEVEALLRDWAALSFRAQAGQDVSREIAHTKAALAGWKFVGSSKVQKAVRAALLDAAVFAGKILLGLVV